MIQVIDVSIFYAATNFVIQLTDYDYPALIV